ncbi:bifunctional GNAT family N-acetyltransferase/acetate--CoA ligase family protein [Arthrobacter roseus]|uniref:bifunctional acetate--CoA ligase family protein/GNAT family N-acetyltransferase n=1 Tax=Arthrobacter roseus TaxID=136274 RepID=UPI0019623021|nr:bifunctional GNAT family N-acetyltransferase/acetate--CoA ligase family protein [Arthrobacter roseus]MBM7848378.1 acyl-CoA synthetase (NDP forming)/RimJ/RimL family protein N-acetyltransferase [Arthrobacter roseus]
MANHGQYPQHWEADVVLRDGGTAHLRPIAPADEEAVQRFHVAQSETSIYLRFFTYKSRLTVKELQRFTRVDYTTRVAFVITMGDEIIGIGRYDRLQDSSEAEVAFNIADKHQGRGLGSILLEHLAAAARENGIRRFSAEVLPENRKMIMVFADAGYEVSRHFDDGVVMLAFSIDPTERSLAVMESREHRAEARSVADLLSPSSVAVIGASRQWGTVGYSILEHIIEGGFEGEIYGVNRDALEIAGMKGYASISDLPGPVQLAVIAVPYGEVSDVVRECGIAGVKGLLIATAGFADNADDGTALQRALVREARSNGMRVIGPASLGLINTNPKVSLNASMAPQLPLRGGLALFSQSAAIGVLLYSAASRRSLGLSSTISSGNRADVSGNDAMQYWEDDTDTKVAGLYLESIGNPRKFSRIARRLAQTKPVIVAKSDVMGLQLPPGHAVRVTQAPQGALDAMLRQTGVIRVTTSAQLMDVAQICATQPLPVGNGVAILSNSLALGKVVADSAASHGLRIAQLSAALDLSEGMSPALELLESTLGGALARDSVHTAVVALLPSPGLSIETLAQCLWDVGLQYGKPVISAFSGILDPTIQAEGILPVNVAGGETTQSGLPSFSSPGDAVGALASVVGYAEWSNRDHGTFVRPDGLNADGASARLEELTAGVEDAALFQLDTHQCAEILGFYGIRVLPSASFDSLDEAVDRAEELGWPVALKTMDLRLRQRLDLGGVRLGIAGPESLRRSIASMEEVLKPYGHQHMELQSMAPEGQACTIRAIEDPLLGPVLSYGMSGDAVDLLDDWGHGIPPLTDVDVSELVRAPRASRRLFGYAGLPASDTDALEELIARTAALKDDHPEIALLEFRPVLVSTSGLTVLSADIHVGNPRQRTDSARRAMRD